MQILTDMHGCFRDQLRLGRCFPGIGRDLLAVGVQFLACLSNVLRSLRNLLQQVVHFVDEQIHAFAQLPDLIVTRLIQS